MIDDQADFLDDILIVLVIYQTEINSSLAYLTLTAALRSSQRRGNIFIYDNSLNAQTILPNASAEIQYVHDASNPGVSKAYNRGFQKAKQLGKKWLLLADQDTRFPGNIFSEYQNCIENFRSQIVVPLLLDHIGFVSPFKFWLGGGERVTNLSGSSEMSIHDFFFHNSGLLISIDRFEQAGCYDENLPLDFSDMAFVMKLRRWNNIFLLSNVVCEHQLATSASANFSERLKRFKSYLHSGRYFYKEYFPSRILLIRFFFRAIKLSWSYRNLKFVILFFKK
ncbi:MAG TPA: hypothetical protein DGG95_13525 [Cytophagales bacterium]|jgi:GT2 family glycosyltransferase|nr:hypothetical protein [Cytophagales bacterium]